MAVEANACTARASTAPHQSQVTSSFATGPEQRAEHLIGEVFGWEFARNEVAPAIFPQLLARYLRADPVDAEYPDLAPSPAVDAHLARSAAIARGEFDPPSSAPIAIAHPSGLNTTELYRALTFSDAQRA
jgi:hypothetical protein